MARRRTRRSQPKQVVAHTHDDASRPNIPTAEYQSLVPDELAEPIRVQYERRNRDLDPQLIWRGKDEQDVSDLAVNALPIYIQEKVQPKALIADLERESAQRREAAEPNRQFADLFADFNGMPESADRTEFYQHDANWLRSGELLRPPRLLPRRQRPVQVAQDHPQSRDRRRSVGNP